MYMYAKFYQTSIPSGYKVMSIQQRQNHRQRMDSSGSYWLLKETKSATMNIFEIFYFLFKSFVKVELSYVFTINLFTIAENCTEK